MIKFITSVAFSPTNHLTAIARACDEAGFDSIIISDHVVHPETIRTPYPYTPDGKPRWEPFTDWPDCWVSIGAMAAVTQKLRFVTGVYVLPMRNPFVVAKAVATASKISGGRVALGVGSGWMKEEFDLLEQRFERRGKRMDEMIEVLRKLWGGGWVEHHGEFYDFDALEMSPEPPGGIPIYAGGLSEAAFRRASKLCDGWVSDMHSTEELRALVGKMKAYRADSPRAAIPFTVIAAVMDAFDVDGYKRAADAGVTHIQTMPWIFYGGTLADLQSKIDGIRRFGDEVIAKIS